MTSLRHCYSILLLSLVWPLYLPSVHRYPRAFALVRMDLYLFLWKDGITLEDITGSWKNIPFSREISVRVCHRVSQSDIHTDDETLLTWTLRLPGACMMAHMAINTLFLLLWSTMCEQKLPSASALCDLISTNLDQAG